VNDVDELKRYADVHARGLEIAGYRSLLDRVGHDGTGPGSWVGEWTAAGDRLTASGRHVQAARHYLMARFPFVDGPARQEAYDKSLASFDRWREGRGLERIEVDFDGHRLSCWAAGLAPDRPVVLILGGFLTVKEQWAPALPIFARLGMAAVGLEMPGVGENQVPYTRSSHRFLSAVLDALAGRADVTRGYALAMSFSGHQALSCALEDPRIRGVVTVGAPISAFFTDEVWRKQLPAVTVDTLAHLTGGDLDAMSDWALTASALAGLEIPVGYVASLRDEVIPQADPQFLRTHVRNLSVLTHDDVHASPMHVEETRAWLTLSLLRMQGARDMRTLLLSAMWNTARARSRVSSAVRSRRTAAG
jgi:esterase FrsA